MPRTRNSNAQRGDFTRKNPKPNSRAASGPAADHPGELEKLDELPGHQGEAIKSLEFGHGNASGAGREFKEHETQPDTPIVEQRPPMPNESARTDMDRHGRGGYRGKN